MTYESPLHSQEYSRKKLAGLLLSYFLSTDHSIIGASPEFEFDFPSPNSVGNCAPDFTAAKGDGSIVYGVVLSATGLETGEAAGMIKTLSARFCVKTLKPVEVYIGIPGNARFVKEVKKTLDGLGVDYRKRHIKLVTLD